MNIGLKVITCFAAFILIITVVPVSKAEAFGFGDVQRQMESWTQNIVQWFSGIGSLFSFGGSNIDVTNNPLAGRNNDRVGSNGDNSPENTIIVEKPKVLDFKPELISVAGCKKEGGIIDGKTGQKCCAGLQSLKVVKLGGGVSCSEEISGYVCAKCGDGVCGAGENPCNCANDCKEGDDSDKKDMTCDQACKATGYQSSYCHAFAWKQTSADPDAFSAEYCLKNDIPMQARWATITDCTDFSDPKSNTKGKSCCCKGEPVNASTCPKINWPSTPAGCVTETGYMKNPENGECCWYKAMCYGPDNWQAFRSKEECQNPCLLDREKQTCCKNGVCNKVGLLCGENNNVDAEWMSCDAQCKPVASCQPKTDVWDTCDALCQKSGKGKVTDCIANVGKSIIDPENGFGCCCEKSVCAKAGETVNAILGQACCEGLKEMTSPEPGEFNSVCIDPANQKEGSSCVFDEDCLKGLKCLSNVGFASKCVNMANQKDGALCSFDDDCAPGFVCSNDPGLAQSQCKKPLGCAKEGEIMDYFSNQECCAGLGSISNIDPLGNMRMPGAALYVCANCGNKICGKGENQLNCSVDCGAPSAAAQAAQMIIDSAVDITLGFGKCTVFNCSGSIAVSGSDPDITVIKCDGKIVKNIKCVGGGVSTFGSFDSSDSAGADRNRACCNPLP